MMKTKEEMMKEAIKMGLNAGAAGCIAVFTAEELESLLGDSNKLAKPVKTEEEMKREITAQLYVDMIDELVDKLIALGYDIIFNGESHETYDGLEIDHRNKVVDITTW